MIIDLYNDFPELLICKEQIEQATATLINSFKEGSKLLCCGNGGSHSDCDHIAGELLKSFVKHRPLEKGFLDALKAKNLDSDGMLSNNLQGSLPVISLPSQGAILSAFNNDVAPEVAYAQLTLGYGRPGDVFLGISTSGNSKNVLYAAKVAKALGLKTIALTGKSGGELKSVCDITIAVPKTQTYLVQQLHLPVYHYICAKIEENLF